MMISERIFELLKDRGMTQKDFSLRTGIAQSSISDWKRKKTNPAAEKILVICEALNVTPYELLGGDGRPGQKKQPCGYHCPEQGVGRRTDSNRVYVHEKG